MRHLAVWTYLFGPILAFLPLRWRKDHLSRVQIRWGTATFFSGLLETVVFFPVLIWWYSYFVTSYGQVLSQSPAQGEVPPGREGLVGLAGFAMNPVTWVVFYIGFEGLVRAAGAMVGGEARGTLFLAVPYYLYEKAARRAAKPELPLVRDEITPGDSTCDIRIASSRAREEWKYPFTIRYGGGYFQVVSMKKLAAGPRPYMYSLRRLPAGEIARGMKEYDPADGLVAAMERLQPVEASLPALGSLGSLREASRGLGKEDLGLKYILGPFVSLLPERWRDAVFHQAPSLLAPGAIISGGIGLVASLLLLGAWFMGDLGVQWSKPQTFLVTGVVAYMGCEGLLRAYLALTTGEVHGTFLLGGVEYFTFLITRPAARPELPAVPDEITPGGGTCDLKISSCRERRDWKYPYTIRYEGTFFQVIASQDVRNGPRPYVYSLRRLPAGEIAGGLKDYNPQDVMHAGTVERIKW
jgi:hypothetical protein